jgi:CheY-like chemotaxis protein
MGAIPVIMLVEDSEEDRDLFWMAFRSSRIQASLVAVHSVADLYERLDSIGSAGQHSRPALIVLDLSMPGLDAGAMCATCAIISCHCAYRS